MECMHETYKDLGSPSAASERNFGYTLGCALVIFSIVYSTWLLAILAAVLITITIFNPSKLKKPNKLWSNLGDTLQKIITPIIMLLIYITVFLPIALILNICRKNIMLQYNTTAPSYWIQKNKTSSALDNPMKYQF